MILLRTADGEQTYAVLAAFYAKVYDQEDSGVFNIQISQSQKFLTNIWRGFRRPPCMTRVFQRRMAHSC